MKAGVEALPDDVEALKAALIVARAEAAAARAQQSDDQALIAHLKLQIEKLNRDRYGPRSERTARLLDQLELTLEELETAATEDELAVEALGYIIRRLLGAEPVNSLGAMGAGWPAAMHVATTRSRTYTAPLVASSPA